MTCVEDLPRVLIIDDEPIVLDSCSEILRDEGLTIATASDGTRGLDLVDEFRPDLALVDIKMPGISGIEVIESLAVSHPTVVTVVITGYATVDTAIEAMKAGAYDFIPKPFTPDQLRLITARGLEKRRLLLETIALRREKEVLRENFAAIVAHELKSPLSAVQQNLFVLRSQLADTVAEDQQHRLARMQARIGDLLAMVDTWLRGVSSDLNGIRERFDLMPVAVPIGKAIESVGAHAIRKSTEISTSIDGGADVFGDEGTLTEAFTNIIGNAVKYSHEGGTVAVSAAPCDDGTRIEISDEGVGIPEEDLPYVFEDFFRAGSGPVREAGVGLGLAISRRIVDAHEGSISVASEVGRGTTFTIFLPAAPADDRVSATTESREGPIRQE